MQRRPTSRSPEPLPTARQPTPPPFDLELAPYLPELQEFMAPDALRPSTIKKVRAMLAEWPVPSLADMEREGRFDVTR